MSLNLPVFNPHPGAKTKAQLTTRVDDRVKRDAQENTAYRAACKAVDTREEYRCRVCGTRVSTGVSMIEKGHHHHVVFASLGGQDTVQNLVLICARCHDLVHVKRTLEIRPLEPELGADGLLEFCAVNPETGYWELQRSETRVGVSVPRDVN